MQPPTALRARSAAAAGLQAHPMALRMVFGEGGGA